MLDEFNAQMQPRLAWPDAAPVARAYLDQMVRAERILDQRAQELDVLLDRAETGAASSAELRAMASTLEADATAVEGGLLGGDAHRLTALAGVLRGMAGM